MLAFKNFLIKSYSVILGFFFLQKYYAQFLVIFTTTSEEQGMFCLYNLKNIEFGYKKLPRLESSSLKRIEEQEPRQIQLYGAERVRVRWRRGVYGVGWGVEGHEGGGGEIRWENVRQEEGEIFF